MSAIPSPQSGYWAKVAHHPIGPQNCIVSHVRSASWASFEWIRNSGNNMQAADRLSVSAITKRDCIYTKQITVLVRTGRQEDEK